MTQFSVHALASGSSGNATLVRSGDAAFLIDAGIGLRRLCSALAALNVPPETLSGIVVTHEHSDHVQSAHAFAKKYEVPLVANERTLHKIFSRKRETHHVVLHTGNTWTAGEMLVSTFPVPHDAAEPVGINIVHRPSAQKVSYVTDAGHVSQTIRDAVRGANLLILEANHDVHRLRAGDYPAAMKARILSDRGHLSNEAAVGLLCEHALRSGPFAAWLAHLSKENNTPKLALGYAQATVAVETNCPVALDVAKRDRPSASWTPGAHVLQLSLF